MTGNLQAIGFLFTWVLGWGIGGSLIDAGLIHVGLYSLESPTVSKEVRSV